MSRIFQFKLIAPENLLFSETVQEVILPGSEGYFSVMANHAPLIAHVIPGFVHVRYNSRSERSKHVFIVFDGFANISDGTCSLSAEFVSPFKNFDKKYIEQRIFVVEREFKNARTDLLRNKAEEHLYQLNALLDLSYTFAAT